MEQRMMMDMSGEEEGGSGMHSDFSEKELEVSEILLNLGEIIAESESASLRKQQQGSELRNRKLQPFTVVWGAKKILVGNTRRNPSTTSVGGGIPAIMATPIRQVKPAHATSPNTPLNFFATSESDDNSSSPSQHKRERDALMESVEELSECGKLLRKEVDSVRSYHDKLVAINKKLKEEKKQMLSATCPSHETEGKSNLEIENNSGVTSSQPYQNTVDPRFPFQPQIPFTNPMATESHPQPQGCPNPNAAGLGQARPPILASNVVLGGAYQVGSPSQSLVLAHARSGECRARVVARAAEARRHRKMMIDQQKRGLKLKSNSKCGSGTGPMMMLALNKS